MKKQNAVRKAVLPVAGLGTRMLPATKAIPKEMLPVVDKPLIQYVVREAIAAGIKEIISWRTVHGGFTSVAQLAEVNGISERFVTEHQAELSLN